MTGPERRTADHSAESPPPKLDPAPPLPGLTLRGWIIVVCTALGGGVASPGCAEFDTTPVAAAERGTLGEDIVQMFCERLASEADPSDVSGARWKPVCRGQMPPPAGAPLRLIALYENRARLAEALDRILPEETTDELGLFLRELLPFFDPPEARLPDLTRRVADLLMSLRADEDALAALERLSARRGYRPLRLSLGILRPALAYSELDAVTDVALQTLLDGAAEEEFAELQRALALEMATIEPGDTDEGSEDRTLHVLRELLFREEDRLATGTGANWAVLRDPRGVALTRTEDGMVLAPFVDQDRDGRPDVDALGRFVDASGDPLDVPSPFRFQGEDATPRDASDRALRSDGTRYYAYLDVHRTLLSALTGEAGPFVDPSDPALLRMARALPVLLGPEVRATSTYGVHAQDYSTFDTDRGPLFDAVHALGAVLHRPETEDALSVAEQLLRDHESETAGLLRSARFLADAADRHPEAQLEHSSVLWDELIAFAVSASHRPGMLEALLRSFSDERTRRLGATYASYMRYRDRVTYDPDDVNGEPLGLPLDEPVDRSMPDTFENESLFQRTLGLIDGLNGVQVCNRAGAVLNIRVLGVPLRYPLIGSAGACDLIAIDNVAEAYARSILGTYELEIQSGFLSAVVDLADTLGIDVDTALEEASGIDGLTRHPTPQALNRLVFWGLADTSGVQSCRPGGDGGTCNSVFAGQLFDPVLDRHGNDVIERYHGTIFAWESPGFYEGMRPMLEVLHRPQYTYDENGEYFFGRLLSTLHQHWASPDSTETCDPGRCSPGAPNFSHQSNARSYEELIAEGFDEGQLLTRLQQMNTALAAVEVRPGVDGVAALATAAEVLVDPRRSAGLTDRRGLATTRVNDGSREVPLSPLYLFLDALSAMDAAWEREPARHQDWVTARRSVADQLLETDTLGEGFRMRNARTRAILLTALPFVRERIAARRADGDLVEWSTGLQQRLADTVREPLFSATLRLLDAVNEDPETRRVLAALVHYLVSETSENDAFASTVHTLADALMVLDDERNLAPLLRALSEALAPNVRDVVAGEAEALELEASTVRVSLALVRDIHDVDREQTLLAILRNAVSLPEAGDPVTPLEVILDVVAEVNRATPNGGGSLRADDYRAVLDETSDFLLDPDHGLERLTAVVQHRRCLPEDERPCSLRGEQRESAGSCYENATCTCSDIGGGMRAWRCAAP